ncbi:MAG: efflux RND transporter periplasmic adaptor subunit [Candidatus Solibacter sp.]|nr:efflux RND transporter periplasmic adaptor subunit [Candidatus Solibacter sp.]
MKTQRRVWITASACAVVVLIVVLLAARAAKGTAPREELIESTVECDEVDISSKVPGRIVEMLVDEGSPVHAGDVLVRISSREIDARVAQAAGAYEAAQARRQQALQGVALQRLTVAGQIGQAEATRAAAKARLEMALTGARVQEVRQAEKALEQASAAYETADATYQRFRGLFKEGVISEQAENEVKLRYLSAKAQKEGAEARLDMVREGTRKEEVEQARQGLAAAEAALKRARDGALQVPIREQEAAAALHQAEAVKGQLEEARAYQSETVILSPIEGYVSERIAKAGETAAAGAPILTLVGRSGFKVKVYADESKFGHLQLDRPVKVVIPALAGAELNGKIIRISQSAEFATKKATNEQNSFDVRALQIVVLITDNDSRLRNGMTARPRLAYSGN